MFSIFRGTLATKYISLNDESCLVRAALINSNPNELQHYTFMVRLYRCNESLNTLNDGRICVPNKTEDITLNVFDMITRTDESNIFHVIVNVNLIVQNVIQIKVGIKISVNVSVENPLKHHVCEKDYVWNPSICVVRLINV